MFSSITNYFSGNNKNKNTEFDPHKCSTYSSALYSARIEAAIAKAILFDAASCRIQNIHIGDMKNLIERLHNSAQSVSESHQNREMWKELPQLVALLAKHPQNAKLSSLPSSDAVRVASIATAAAALVKERTETRQVELLASLDQATRGRFKAVTVVDAESRRSSRLHTLLLSNLIFDSAAKNALRNTLRNHQIVVVDLSNCFLGDDETISLLKSDLSALSQLSVLSLRGNALTNGVVPYFISNSSSNSSSSNASSSSSSDNDNNNNISSRDNQSRRGPAYLESTDKFLSLRVLILDDNEIASQHLLKIKATLARRWQRFVEKYDPSANINAYSADQTSSAYFHHLQQLQGDASSSNFMSLVVGNQQNQQLESIPRPTTTTMNFRNTTIPSIFLSLDGNGLPGIVQAKYLVKNPEVASSHQTPIECIVATSSSVVTACALALGNISLQNVCNAFKRLQEEVFSRSEMDAQHYAESAGMWIRSWWTGGDYYNSAKAKTILEDLFGTAKFTDFPCSRVIAVLESSNGQVLYASSPTSSPLWNQCHTFLPSDPYCPSVAEVCLAAMAAPGRFAPRKLYKSRHMSSSSQNNNNNMQQNLSVPPTEQLILFDACGSTPNPSHIALIECMRPTTKPRRLVSIATENETHVASLPEDGIASISAAALSNWPNARVVLSELEQNNSTNGHHTASNPSSGELYAREQAYSKLLANHSYIARATSISVSKAVESTLENEEALRELNRRMRKTKKNNKNKNEKTEEEDKKEEEVNSRIDENEQNPKTLPETEDQEMKSIHKFTTSKNQNDDDDEKEKQLSSSRGKILMMNKRRQRNNFANNNTTTAIYYERLYPCEVKAPELKYDETSTRMLAVAVLDQNVSGYSPEQAESRRNFFEKNTSYYKYRVEDDGELFDDEDYDQDEHEEEDEENHETSTTTTTTTKTSKFVASEVIRGGRKF